MRKAYVKILKLFICTYIDSVSSVSCQQWGILREFDEDNREGLGIVDHFSIKR